MPHIEMHGDVLEAFDNLCGAIKHLKREKANLASVERFTKAQADFAVMLYNSDFTNTGSTKTKK